jgi:FMN-dependent oxidoreductase (nitrilotriacetate monooxygenase family)
MAAAAVVSEPARTLRIGLFLFATGYHPAGWRLPEARTDGAFDLTFLIELARTVERAKFDFFFLGDGLATDPDMARLYPSQVVRLEPFTMMGAIAAATRDVGLVVTANTTYAEPYNVARMLASLDHLSHGRIAWNVVTGADPLAAFNFGRADHWDTDRRYDQAEEFVAVVRDLWDSWEDDALLRDARSGAFLDPTKVHRLDHVGPHFSVAGPLNVARPPQGHPPLVQAGTSERARQLGARLADVVFTAQTTIEDARAFRTDLRGRAATEPAVLPGLVPIVADTVSGAQELYDRLGAFVDAEAALISLQASVGATAQTLAELGPAAAVDRLPSAAASHVAAAEAAIGRPVQTLGDLARFQLASGRGHRLIVGDGARVADSMQEWLEAGAADGFNICPPYLPGGLERFTQLVVPELQRRGIFRREYEGPTFRHILGLPRPPSRFAVKRR